MSESIKDSRRLPQPLCELAVLDLDVGADGDGREVDVPDGVVGGLDGGVGGVLAPVGVDGREQDDADHHAGDRQQGPAETGK